MLATLQEARQSGIAKIAGVDANGDEFVQLINDATRRLMRRGDWEGTIVPIQVCLIAGCVVWPAYVGQIRKLNVCNRPVEISNKWFSFLPFSQRCWSDAGWRTSWCGSRASMISQTHSPTFSSVAGEVRYIRAYPSTPLDKNKTITIFGEDNNGQPLMTTGVGGWQDGITLTLNTPYVSTTGYVRRIDRVLKDRTQGPVRLYGYDTANSVLEDLAVYGPGETNPNYLRTKLSIPSNCDSNSCPTSRSVVALVKLQYVPVVANTDPVLIANLDALKLFIQAIKCEEGLDRQTARGLEGDAIRELNLELFDANPDDQCPVSILPFETTDVGKQHCF
jgi:hypothetical protein